MALMLWLSLLSLAAAQVLPDEPDPSRRPGMTVYITANTSEGSPLQRNVETVIKFLFQHNPPNGFATSLGYGDFPYTAYGHSGCYNMSDQPSCSECIQQAYRNIQRVAPFTIGGLHWINDSINHCRVRFDSNNFTSELIPLRVLGVIGPNVSAPPPAPSVLNSPTPLLAPHLSSTSSRSSSTVAIVGGSLGGVFSLLSVVGLLVWKWRWRRKPNKLDEEHRYQEARSSLERSIEGRVVFAYEELSVATDDFSDRNKLGKGGFGTVYKGHLRDGTQVAIKKLGLQSQQGRKEFVNEINIITAIRHRNLVRLKGYCVQGDERLVVYEFLEKGSLDRALFESSLTLNWHSRFQISVGFARGLAYLHEESHIQIIHRDIKASNILLDKKLQPKISDFGISKLFDMEKGFTSTVVAGTYGYMAPEYAMRGRLTSKGDVFSYGVLVLELVSGRKCVDSTLPSEENLLLQRMWALYESGKLESCIDDRLREDYVVDEADRLIRIAMMCTQANEESRPAMSDVVAMLLGHLEVGPLPDQAPVYLQGNLHGGLDGSGGEGTISITNLEPR